MSEKTKIEWCDATFNPWRGCSKVSAGCVNCYAERFGIRQPDKFGVWGPNGNRVLAGDAYWKQPLVWNRKAEREGRRFRVFCGSLMDVFEDRSELTYWRSMLVQLIYETPRLDWLLLTKRPENVLRMMVEANLYAVENPSLPCPQPNLWLGTSVENQQSANDRIPHLLRCPAALRFISAEPLLEEVVFPLVRPPRDGATRCRDDDGVPYDRFDDDVVLRARAAVDFLIVGPETGPRRRECKPSWIRFVIEQCDAAGVRVFVKAFPVGNRVSFDVSEWPVWARYRELPGREPTV